MKGKRSTALVLTLTFSAATIMNSTQIIYAKERNFTTNRLLKETAQNKGKQTVKAATKAVNSIEVSDSSEFSDALKDDAIQTIIIVKSFRITSLNKAKDVVIQSGVQLQLDAWSNMEVPANIKIESGGVLKATGNSPFYRIYISGELINNGEILLSNNRLYTDYGKISGAGNITGNTDNYYINIKKDITKNIEITLPDTITAGDTVSATFTNLIDGVDVKKAFSFKWNYTNSNKPNFTEATFTVPVAAGNSNLKLIVSSKDNYVMLNKTGSDGSINSKEYLIDPLELKTVYLDANNGDDDHVGNRKDAAFKTLNEAVKNVTDGGTIIILSDCMPKNQYFTFDKSITIKSDDNHIFTIEGQSSSNEWSVNDDVTVTFSNVSMGAKPISFLKYSSGKGTGKLVFEHAKAINNIDVYNMASLTLIDSEFTGKSNATKFYMTESTLNGSFSTNDFISVGDNTINLDLDANCSIKGTATIDKPITLVPAKVLRNTKLIAIPETSVISTSDFVLSDTKGDKFTLKKRKLSNGTYIAVSERIESGAKFHVGYEPVAGEAVKDSNLKGDQKYVGILMDAANTQGYVQAAAGVWSGYSDSEHPSWNSGDIPKLTVTLKTSNEYLFHFDRKFDLKQIAVYSWKDMNDIHNIYLSENINQEVQVMVEDGQGVSDDGLVFTFTIIYPEVKQLKNEWLTDLSITNWKYGETANKPSAISKYGSVSYEYSNHKTGTYTTDVPSEAGTWYVKARVPGSRNYGELVSNPVAFIISQTSNEWTNELSIAGWKFGGLKSEPNSRAKYGSPIYTYCSSKNGIYTSTVPVDAGTWYVKAVLEGTQNYTALETDPVSFVIEPKDYSDKSNIVISDIESPGLEGILIKDGSITLEENVDYQVSRKQQGNKIIVTVTFIGNYTGVVTKEYTADSTTIPDNKDTDQSLTPAGVNTGDTSKTGLWFTTIVSLGTIGLLFKRRKQ